MKESKHIELNEAKWDKWANSLYEGHKTIRISQKIHIGEK
jgi:hypothetical protein